MGKSVDADYLDIGKMAVAEHEPVCAQLAKKDSGILAWTSNNVASRTRAGFVPLYSAVLRQYPESSVQFWIAYYKNCWSVSREEQWSW
ncbi:hypothetical protein TURU_041769 [Turdus rufiventris]|nr:hypothetical protein TURU_041769 [Turdus rufiventris]